jgi:hypothetical protein
MTKFFVFYIACLVLALVPLFFVYNRVYKDGLVGKLGLLGISFVAWMWIFDLLINDEAPLDPSNRTVMFVISVAIFLVWHLFRFHNRVLRKNACPPDCPQDRRRTPDRRFTPTT